MRDEDDDIEDDGDDAPAPAAKPTKPVLPRLVKPGEDLVAPSAPKTTTQLARVVRPSAEQEVVEMLAEQTRFPIELPLRLCLLLYDPIQSQHTFIIIINLNHVLRECASRRVAWRAVVLWR